MAEQTKKRERIASFDIIRTICPFLIVIYHFSAEALNMGLPYVQPLMNSVRFETTLFFMVSGASLMLTQGNRFELKTYAKKRLLSIFPLFYITWILAFIAFSVVSHGLMTHTPWTFPFTLIGFDGYLNVELDTWYMGVGEWFLGALIFCYALFPVLRLILKKKKGFLLIFGLLAVEISHAFLDWITLRNLLVAVVSFSIGMELCEIRAWFEKRPWIAPITATLAALYMIIVKFSLPYLFSVQVVAFLLFVTLISLETYLKKALQKAKWLAKTVSFLSGLSYPMFLIQHLVVLFVLKIVPTVTGTGWELLLLILFLCVLGAFVLNTVYKFLSEKVRLLFQRKSLRTKGD